MRTRLPGAFTFLAIGLAVIGLLLVVEAFLNRIPAGTTGDGPTPISQVFDGAYSLVLLNAVGDMLVARDPLGIKPLCYAKEGQLFAAVPPNTRSSAMCFTACRSSLPVPRTGISSTW